MSKDYGQFCGLAKAAAALGERWALLVVRDLTVGPRRFTELQAGLPGVPTSVLTARLRELESHGIVERRPAPPGQRGTLYALTPYGADLGPVLDDLGRWGARRMLEPDPDDTVTDASLAAALRAAYRPAPTVRETTYLVRSGPAAAWATVHGGDITVGVGAPDHRPDLTITTGPQMRALLAGRITAEQTLATGAVEIDGDPRELTTFTRLFHVPLDEGSGPRHLPPHRKESR